MCSQNKPDAELKMFANEQNVDAKRMNEMKADKEKKRQKEKNGSLVNKNSNWTRKVLWF